VRGEVVLVTGGSSGIGLETARRFAGLGARVVLAARDPARLEAAVGALGPGVRAVGADVTSEESVRALADSLAEVEGRLDVLVNGAGVLELGPAEVLGPAVAERLMQTNYLGAVRVLHAVLPLLRRGRRRSIVNVSSLAGKVAPPFMAPYAASKSALAAYTYALRQELRAEGFHLALVSPGPADTPMLAGRGPGVVLHYPIPPGIPMVDAGAVADAIVRVVRRRSADVTVPRHLAPAMRLGKAFPRLVDWTYRFAARTRGEAEARDIAPRVDGGGVDGAGTA
jgi:NAD(P)-dependent dehydrogenase (short-subunit alcohol dehydrogenase family)